MNLVKADVMWWLSHGAACRRCQEQYVIITEALDDIVSKKGNPDLLVHWNTLLEMQMVFQITFLEDVLCVTNALSLLQSNVKDFAAISHIISSMLQILEDIGNNFDSIHLKSFNRSTEIIEKIGSYQKWNIVPSGTRTKRSRQDYTDTQRIPQKSHSTIYYCTDKSNERCVWPDKLTSSKFESTEFPVYHEHEIIELYNHYSARK